MEQATRLVELWFDNEEDTYYEVRAVARSARSGSQYPTVDAADALKEWFEERYAEDVPASGPLADLVTWAMQQVDWRQIVQGYAEEDEEDEEDDDPIVHSPSAWSYRSSQENGDQVDCYSCGNALNDDLPIVNDDEGFAHHEGCLHDELPEVPDDWEVQPLDEDEAEDTPGAAQCGSCKRWWDDSVSTGMTPVPSGRCPFEPFHAEES